MTWEGFVTIVTFGLLGALRFVGEAFSGWMGAMILMVLSFCIATRLVGTRRRSDKKA